MLVEYPNSLEREMQTKKSHEIPDIQWGQTPDLQEWIEASKAERERQQSAMRLKETLPAPKAFQIKTIFDTFKSNNEDCRDQIAKAKHKVLYDIGVNEHMIVVSLDGGDLVVDFDDPTIFIEPHENGMVVAYHEFTGTHTLTDLSAGVQNYSAGLMSCFFSFVCNNRSFEYLIQPTVATRSLDFQLTFQEWDQ